jgi:hypothetical protein
MAAATPSSTPELDEIWERIRTLELEPHVAELDAYGLTVIPPERAAPPGFTDRLTETILDLAEHDNGERPSLETGAGYENRYGPSLYFLLMRDRVFEEAVLNPMSLTLVDYLTGVSSLLNFCGATLKGPGTDEFVLHADTGVPAPMPMYAQVCNSTYILSDYNRENGGLMWVPGSHKLCRQPTRADAERAVPLEAPAGSLAVWHGNTWHGAYPRTVPGMRLTLITSYFRSYLRTQELYRERVTEEMLDRNPPRFATLMGQHVTFGWDERGPQYERFMNYGKHARPGVSQHS